MRLIDADELVFDYGGLVYIAPCDCAGTAEYFVKQVREAPTVDAVPVVHGRWVISCDRYYPYCSECKKEPKGRSMTDYCPNCGAKMDEETP